MIRNNRFHQLAVELSMSINLVYNAKAEEVKERGCISCFPQILASYNKTKPSEAASWKIEVALHGSNTLKLICRDSHLPLR